MDSPFHHGEELGAALTGGGGPLFLVVLLSSRTHHKSPPHGLTQQWGSNAELLTKIYLVLHERLW